LKYFTITFQGEISEAAENIINRDFHSEKPNEKVLTDITEFSIPATNADLVNSMLDDYHSKLKEDEKPIVHSDRGVSLPMAWMD
jgi:putative transposase